jgi:hypothetical protein
MQIYVCGITSSPGNNVFNDQLTTSNNTLTTLTTIPVADNYLYMIDAKILAASDTGSGFGASFKIDGAYLRVGTLAKLDDNILVLNNSVNATAWTVSSTTSGTDILIQVVGDSTLTVRWYIFYKLYECPAP